MQEYEDWDDDFDFSIAQGEQFVLFFLNESLFALESHRVVEIVEYPSITTMPTSHKAICGVANIRGSITGIIDLGKLVWGIKTVMTPHTSVVIVSHEAHGQKFNAGLIVDEVLEVDAFEPSDFLEKPQFGFTIDKKFIKSISTYKQNNLILLDLTCILDVDILAIGGRA